MGRTQRPSIHQRGFISFATLIVGLLISAMFGFLIMYFVQAQNKLQAHIKTLDEMTQLTVSIKMLFMDPTACRQNLIANGFGANKAQLDSLSSSGKVVVRLPAPSGVAGAVMAASGSQYFQLPIQSVSFKNLSQPFLPDQSWKAELNIEVKSPLHSLPPIVVPFYFVSNDGLNFTNCQATSYTPANLNLPPPLPGMPSNQVTLEDIFCSQISADLLFMPQERGCIPKSKFTNLPATGL